MTAALHKVADYRMIALRTEPPTAPTDYLSRPATPVTN